MLPWATRALLVPDICHAAHYIQGVEMSTPSLTGPVVRQTYRSSLALGVVCWLLNVPATCECVSGTDLLRQFFTCCHTEIEVADPTFHLTQSQYIDTGPTSPSTDPITPGAWLGCHWSANFEVTGTTRPRRNSAASGIRTPDLPLSRRTP